MSYIHDALKKAQKEKDRGGGYYDGVVSAKKGERSFSPRTWILISLAFLSLLTMIIFSWHHRQHIPSSAIQDKTRPDPVALEKPVAEKAEKKETAHVLYNEGLYHQKNGSLHDAKKKYLQVLRMEPNFVFALNNLGVIYLSEGGYPEARRLFEKAITLDPDYADPHYNLACVHAQLNDLAISVDYLKTAIGFDKRVRGWARADKDLMKLHGYPEYEKMISGK
jgi:tetratricopeptide (TPR) repeat protein